MTQAREVISQIDTRSPDALKRDLSRLATGLNTELSRFAQRTLERWLPARTRTTALKFDQLTTVTDGTVYLPRATPQDAGRRCALVKSLAAGEVVVAPTNGALINTFDTWATTQLGLHELWWDGSAWWAKALPIATPGAAGIPSSLR